MALHSLGAAIFNTSRLDRPVVFAFFNTRALSFQSLRLAVAFFHVAMSESVAILYTPKLVFSSWQALTIEHDVGST